MQKRPFILLTGDDSIRAEGLILVKRVVEQFADFKIVGTKQQQSAVGAKITVSTHCAWGTEIVDGTEALWVEGTPSDAVFFAYDYLDRTPDLVVSGVNLGINVSNQIHRSGTVAAAVTAAQTRQTKAIAFSMQTPDHDWFREHDGSFNEKLIAYPGNMVEFFIKKALDAVFPPEVFWNVNFPATPTQEVAVVPTGPGDYWENRTVINREKYTLSYNEIDPPIISAHDTDSHQIAEGKITLTPCKVNYTDHTELATLQKLF
jgi:5'-nucleotidase